MATTTDFEEIFGAVAQQTIEIDGRINNATQDINNNTTGAVSAAVVEIGGHINNATQDINNNTAGTVAQGTAETVAQVRRSEDNIIAKLTGEKEWWFIILLAAMFVVGVFLMYLYTKNIRYIMVPDADGNPKATENYCRWIIVMLVPLVPTLLLSLSSIGTKKANDERG